MSQGTRGEVRQEVKWLHANPESPGAQAEMAGSRQVGVPRTFKGPTARSEEPSAFRKTVTKWGSGHSRL